MTALDQEINAVALELRKLVARGDELLMRLDGKRFLPGVTPARLKQVETIAEAVCKKYAITTRQLYSPTREQPIAHARQICMTLVRAKLGLSFENIGGIFKRDHGSIFHGIKRINGLIATDSQFALEFAALKTEIETQLKP